MSATRTMRVSFRFTRRDDLDTVAAGREQITGARTADGLMGSTPTPSEQRLPSRVTADPATCAG
jgi:hypothetical protein